MKLKSAVLAVAISIGSVTLAQTPAPPAKPVAPSVPQLKPEVALELTQIQNNELKIISKQQELKTQFLDLQKQFDALQTSYFTQQASALKRSGIDDTKYVLNPDTLQVTEKPAPPEAPKPPANDKR